MADELELEDELLQLAGRSQGSKRPRSKRTAGSDSEEDLLDLGSDDDDDIKTSKRGRGSKKQKTSRSKAGRESDEDEDDEDGYGSDLYKDEEDRARLEAMTELEREMIISERAEERVKARQRRELLKKVRGGTDKASGKAEKGKAARKGKAEKERKSSSKGKGHQYGSESDGEGGDDSEIEYEAGGSSDEEEELLDDEDMDSASDEDGEVGDGVSEDDAGPAASRRSRRPTTRATAGSSVVPSAAEVVATTSGRGRELEDEPVRGMRRETFLEEDEMDVDGRDLGQGVSSLGHDDDEAADPHELRSIQLTRTQLEAMYDKPFFEGEGLAGALVRMAYGPASTDKDGNQVPTYWMMQIISIKDTNSSYPFGPRQAPCHKRLELRDGARVVRTLPMTTVSNQPLEDTEIERFGRHAGRVNDRPISKQQVTDIKQRIQDAINYRWDSAKVKEVLARKRETGYMPVNIAAEKSRLKRLLEEAQSKTEKDHDLIASLEAQLEALEERGTAKSQAGNKAFNMSTINQRNKEINFKQTIRNVSNRPANAPERKGGSDPFSRRTTRPSIYWNTAQKGKDDSPAPEQIKAPTASVPTDQTMNKDGKLKGSLQKLAPMALVQALDLRLDVTPLQDVSVIPPLHLRLLGPRWWQSLSHHTHADLSGKTLLAMSDWQQRANL